MSKRLYHPCHKLSVPSAKLFFCRHCMQMFEDAISRWRHSKVCHACPNYRITNKDAKVIQMYVKPDTVSYTSNVSPGDGVVHKPIVKKTSAELRCMICKTKFDTLHDMREHVKYPCQKNNYLNIEDEYQSESGHIKIRRIESEEDIAAANTPLSVLAEASKHVESLAKETVEEQIIEESVGVEECITDCTGDSFYVPTSSAGLQETSQKVVIAYPRVDIARPELGKVTLALQGDNGTDLPENFLTIDIIQECLKDTTRKLPVGQIIEVILNSEKERTVQFVVGGNGSLLPYYNQPTPDYIEVKTVLDNKPKVSDPKALKVVKLSKNDPHKKESWTTVTTDSSNFASELEKAVNSLEKTSQLPSRKEPASTLEQILTGNLDVHILRDGRIRLARKTADLNDSAQQKTLTKTFPIEPITGADTNCRPTSQIGTTTEFQPQGSGVRSLLKPSFHLTIDIDQSVKKDIQAESLPQILNVRSLTTASEAPEHTYSNPQGQFYQPVSFEVPIDTTAEQIVLAESSHPPVQVYQTVQSEVPVKSEQVSVGAGGSYQTQGYPIITCEASTTPEQVFVGPDSSYQAQQYQTIVSEGPVHTEQLVLEVNNHPQGPSHQPGTIARDIGKPEESSGTSAIVINQQVNNGIRNLH